MISIYTPRLILRDLLETDFHAFYALCSNPEVTHFQDFLRVRDEDHARELLKDAHFHNNLVPRSSYSMAITHKDDHDWMGWIGFGKSDDPSIGDMVFGYALHRKYWGNGYMTEALMCVVDYCFNEHGINKIYGECIQENIASVRVMEKAGLRLEYCCPDIDDITGQATTALRFSMTREQWAQLGSSTIRSAPH